MILELQNDSLSFKKDIFHIRIILLTTSIKRIYDNSCYGICSRFLNTFLCQQIKENKIHIHEPDNPEHVFAMPFNKINISTLTFACIK